jgi:hypothetical protein
MYEGDRVRFWDVRVDGYAEAVVVVVSRCTLLLQRDDGSLTWCYVHDAVVVT